MKVDNVTKMSESKLALSSIIWTSMKNNLSSCKKNNKKKNNHAFLNVVS